MKKILFILSLFISAYSFGQPSGYTEGTRVEWTYNGRSHTYFRSVGWSMSNGVVINFFRGDGETSTSGSSAHTLSKWILDAGPNWDGTITLPDNSKKKVLLLEINNTSSANYDLYENDITFFYNNHSSPAIDTSQHDKFLISGLSGGCKRAMALLCNYYGNSLSYDFPYRHIYGHAAFMSTPDNSLFSFSSLNHAIKFWWIVGANDAGLTAPVNSSNSSDFCAAVGNPTQYTSQVGGDHSDNVWDNWMDTTTAGKSVSEKIMVWAFAPTVAINKITGINWRDVVNMAGGFEPWTMFDEQTNIDPANGDVTPIPTTMDLPTYPNRYSSTQNNESRFYVKLRGAFNLTAIDLHRPELGTYFGDTIILYKGLHTPENPLTSANRIATIYVPAGGTAWQLVALSGANSLNVSIVTIGIKGSPDASFPQISTRPDITEMVFYGDLQGSRSAALPTTLTYSHRPKGNLLSKIGVNNGSGYLKTNSLVQGSKKRVLIDLQFIPGNNAASPSNTFNQNPFGDYPGLIFRTERYFFDSLYTFQGVSIMPEFFHATTRAQSQGAPTEFFGTDNFADNPDAPASYKIKADLGWNYAKMYGVGALNDTSNLKTYGVPRYSGLGLVKRLGFNNESDYLSRGCDTCISDSRYYSVFQTFVEGSMFRDGHAGVYGPRLGVKVADATISIVAPGTIGLLGRRYHDLVSISKDMRTDGVNIIDVAAAHIYPNNDYLGVVPPYGIHPVEFRLRQKVQLWADTVSIVDSAMKIIITEGASYDANDTVNGFGNRSQYAVPDTSSLTTREKQANLYAYGLIEVWASDVEETYDFELFNNNDESNNGSYQTSNDVKLLPSYFYFPKFYFKKQLASITGSYIWEQEIANVWRGNYVQKGYLGSDITKKCYFVGIPNNGGLTTSITVNVGIGSTATLYDMSYNSTTPSTSSLSVDGSGNVVVSAADKPKIILVNTVSVPVQTGFRYRKGRIRFR